MRITFFTIKFNSESGGGSHRALDLRLRYLAKQGHQIRLVTLYSQGNRGLASTPYIIHQLSAEGKRFPELQKFVLAEMKKLQDSSDIFYMEGPSFIWAGGKYRKTGGIVPTVAFINHYQASMGKYHNDYSAMPFWLSFIKKVGDGLYRVKRIIWEKLFGIHFVNYLDRIYFDSPVIQNIYIRWGVRPDITTVLPNFLDVNNFFSAAKSSPFNQGFNILYTGRFSHDKGVDLLVEAMKILSNLGITLHLVGGGPQLQILESLIRRYNLEKSVKIYPWKKSAELINFYVHADIFVHPCRWPEPFGRTVLEAMAAGTPVITTVGTGSAWVVGDSGLTFKKGDVPDLIDKIIKLKNDSALRKALSINAKKRSQEFDYLNFAPRFEQELVDLVKP